MTAKLLHSVPMLATAGRWLAQRAPRERWLIAVAAALVAIGVLYWGAWQPMQRDIARMREESKRTTAALAAARRIADEIPGLERARAALPTTPLQADAERVATKIIGHPAGLAFDTRDQRVQVTIVEVSVDQLALLLEALQREARIQVAEARLTARVEPGSVRAELLLSR